MKLSYIITPFENGEYLIRCINSLKRQIGCDYEIILAETDFGEAEEKIRTYLELHSEVRHFEKSEDVDTETKKLEQALDSSKGDYVIFLNVETVVAPCAAKSILESAFGEMVLIKTLVRNGEEYVPAWNWGQNRVVGLQRDWVCFSKAFFDQYKKEVLTDERSIQLLYDIALCNEMCNETSEICFYAKYDDPDKETSIAIDTANLRKLADCICKNKTTATMLQLYHRYINKIKFEVLALDIENEQKEMLYESLVYFGTAGAHNNVYRSIFEEECGLKPEEMLELDLAGYLEYRSIKNVPVQNPKEQTEILKTLIEKKCSEQDKQIKKVVAELGITQTNLHLLEKNINKKMSAFENACTPIQQVSVIQDPITEVPGLFAEGRLGLRVILKCIASWIKCKFGWKREA